MARLDPDTKNAGSFEGQFAQQIAEAPIMFQPIIPNHQARPRFVSPALRELAPFPLRKPKYALTLMPY
jgi:hypothetical protein